MSGHKRGVWSAVFSPVDPVIATCSGDQTIKLWGMTDFACIKTLEGHSSSVLRVHFVSSGLSLVSCGSDGLLKLWNIKTNECINTLDEHSDKIWALAVSQDQSTFVSGGADSSICIWQDHTPFETELEKAKKEQQLLLEQDLSNSIHKKDYKNAILLCLRLEHSIRLHDLFQRVKHENQGIS